MVRLTDHPYMTIAVYREHKRQQYNTIQYDSRMMHPTDADQLENNVNPDQTAPKEQSDLGVHCFLRHLSQYTEFSCTFINCSFRQKNTTLELWGMIPGRT